MAKRKNKPAQPRTDSGSGRRRPSSISEVIVAITTDARAAFLDLPLPIQGRVRDVFVRLKAWPSVSGAKPLTGTLAGNYRIRTGDYRIVFSAKGSTITIWKIGNRKDVYLD